jgi:type II secretory pathway component PulM
MTPREWFSGVERWWQSRQRLERHVVGIGATILVLGVTLSIWAWLRNERGRLENSLAIAELQLKEVQDDLAEIQQLRGDARPPQVATKNLVAPLSNSLRAAGIVLSVSLADSDRLRLNGSAGFDETINWLGTIQKDYRLTIVTMLVKRETSKSQFEIILGAPGS